MKNVVSEELEATIMLGSKHIEDYCDYAVTTGKAGNVSSFKPDHSGEITVRERAQEKDNLAGLHHPLYINIQVFKDLAEAKGSCP